MKNASVWVGTCLSVLGVSGCFNPAPSLDASTKNPTGSTSGSSSSTSGNSSSSTVSSSSSSSSSSGSVIALGTSSSSGSVPGGVCSASTATPSTLATGQDFPYWVAVDATSLYWTDFYSVNDAGFTVGGSVMKSDRNGGPAVVLATGQQGIGPLVVTAAGVYWVTSTGDVMTVGLDGTGLQVLASDQPSPSSLAVTATHAYWTNAGSVDSSSGDGDPLAGSGTLIALDLASGAMTTLASGLQSPSAVAVDATSVYWTNEGTEAADYTDGTVMKVGLDGQGQITLASGFGGRFASGIAVDTSSVYWAASLTLDGQGGAIYRVGLDGSGLRTIVAIEGIEGQLALDSEHVFFNASADDLCGDGGACAGILATDLDGGCLTTLATAQQVPWGIAVDATRLYWVNNAQFSGANQGTVMVLDPK